MVALQVETELKFNSPLQLNIELPYWKLVIRIGMGCSGDILRCPKHPIVIAVTAPTPR
jgi:hypothetical protein